MNGSIYLIKNSVNNKVYIGQTTQKVEVRFKQHLKLLKTNEKQAISRAIKSIGKDKFDFAVLKTGISSYRELNELEENFIKEYNSLVPNGYNLCPGGQKWRRMQQFNDEEVAKICSEYEKGMSSRELGKIFGVSHHSILKTLTNNNVEIRKRNYKLPDRTSKITKELMQELYIDKNMNAKDIADMLGVHVKTIDRAKNRYNMKRI